MRIRTFGPAIPKCHDFGYVGTFDEKSVEGVGRNWGKQKCPVARNLSEYARPQIHQGFLLRSLLILEFCVRLSLVGGRGERHRFLGRVLEHQGVDLIHILRCS